ncbi:lipid II flippase MurJ [Dokdonella sp.]|uniref:murein biosynthesis integral membrane protein MurJ n=1 Tax=Dokdonella sp. TaxID=2291710 RepID=UPI001B2804A2|nr:lipid II flippase MurJ [Dokdonella sp.]MBO9661982.1 polysaccharide biosynthesis C-terminal domain-containing protein [Dokdonella sp.]
MSAGSRKATIVLSGLNLGGKLLALGKTLLIAGLFGTSGMLDSFWVAYSLPLLLPGLLTSTLTIAFVPRFVANLAGRTGSDVWRGANTLLTLVLLLALAGSVLMYLKAGALVRLMAPGLAPDTHERAVTLTRMLLPCVGLITMSSLLSALSLARERFVLPGLEGIVNNVAVVGCALLFAHSMGVTALIWGVILGYAMQAGLLLYGNRDLLASSIRPAFDYSHADFRAPFGHLLPLFVGSAGAMLTGFVDQYFVSLLDSGSISALSYASMLAYLPLEVFAQAVITTYYPPLGRLFAAGDSAGAAATYAHGVRFLLFLTLPCATLLALLAQPVVELLLQRGHFDTRSTLLTVEALGFLSLVVIARAHAYFSYRVLHAARWAWTQVAIGLAGVATCIALNALWARELGLRGIALSTLIAAIQSAALSTWAVRRLLGVPWPPGFGRDLAGVVLPCLVLIAIVLPANHWIGPADGDRLRAFAHCLIALPALAAALAVAWVLRQRDLRDAVAMLSSRLRTKRSTA